MSKKIILVVGATGKQGSSVAHALLEDGKFAVRCMIRGVSISNSGELDSLIKEGAHVVYGDLENVDSLVKAMEGCHGVFAVTNYWDPKVGYDGEIRQGMNLANAAKRAGISHMVYSTLDYNSDVPHFESKVQAEGYIRKAVPTTSLVTSFYYENFMGLMAPKEQDGVVTFAVAQKKETKVPMYSVSETGRWVVEAFNHPELYINKDICAVGEYISYPQLVETFEKVTGKKAQFVELPFETLFNAEFPGAEELALNLKFFDEIHITNIAPLTTGPCGTKYDRRSIEKRADGRITWDEFIEYTSGTRGETWEQFLKRTKWSG